MKTSRCLMFGILLIAEFAAPVHAGTPVWTITPLTPTKITLASDETAVVQYRITNRSKKAYSLAMEPIAGVTPAGEAGGCGNPITLSGGASCDLTLKLDGRQIARSFAHGPVLCSGKYMCYGPAASAILSVTVAGHDR